MRKKIDDTNSYKQTKLYRAGLKFKPDKKFVDLFKENYMTLLHKTNNHEKDEDITDERAIFFINSVCEAITFCLDFGIDVWLNKTMVFVQKIANYKGIKMPEDGVKKIKIRANYKHVTRMRNEINKDNPEFQEYVKHKKDKYDELKEYYKEFYGQPDWWQDSQEG